MQRLAARFCLGLAEGGLIPGVVMWVSIWYKRSEIQLRLAWIFSFISMAGAFAGCKLSCTLYASCEEIDQVLFNQYWLRKFIVSLAARHFDA